MDEKKIYEESIQEMHEMDSDFLRKWNIGYIAPRNPNRPPATLQPLNYGFFWKDKDE